MGKIPFAAANKMIGVPSRPIVPSFEEHLMSRIRLPLLAECCIGVIGVIGVIAATVQAQEIDLKAIVREAIRLTAAKRSSARSRQASPGSRGR